MPDNLPEGFTVDSTDPSLPQGFTLDKPTESFAGAGIVEPVRAVASSIGREITGGIVGIGQTLNPFAEEGAGAQAVEEFRQGAFKPETPEGQENLKIFGELVQKGVDIVNFPISGLFGLSELISGEGIDKAVETVKSVQDKGLGKTLGERSFEETGSPFQATVGEVFPELALSLTGARPVAKTARLATDTPSAALQAAKKGVESVSPVVKEAAQEAKETATALFEFQSPTKQRIARLLEEGSTDAETAGFKLEPSKLQRADDVPLTKLQKTLGVGEPKVSPDLLERSALNQGFDRGVIASIKGSSKADKRSMLQMVEIRKKGKENSEFEAVNRPADVVGDSLLRQVNFVKSNNTDAGRQLERVAKGLKGKDADISEAIAGFISDAEDMGVTFDDKIIPNFEGSTIETIGPSRKLIKDIALKIRRNQKPDALQSHDFKKFIDENVTFGRAAKGLGGRTETIAKKLRSNINDSLGESYPAYKEANVRFSDTVRAIESLQKASGGTVNLFGPSSDKATGVVLRRLMGNGQSRANLMDSIKEIEDVASKYGGSFEDSIIRQALFVDELDRVFGPVARTSFQGQIDQALKQGVNAATTKQGAIDLALTGAGKVIDKAQGINEANAFKSIKELLKKGNK